MTKVPFNIINPEVDANFRKYYKRRLSSGKPFTVTITGYKVNRSINQNNLMWKWYEYISNSCGDSKDDLHFFAKLKYCKQEGIDYYKKTIAVVGGHKKERVEEFTTTTLSVKEMTAFLQVVESLAEFLNVKLPSPEYFGYNFNKEKNNEQKTSRNEEKV